MDQMQPRIQKLCIAKHCANIDNKRKHPAQMTQVRPGSKALKGGFFQHIVTLTVGFALSTEADFCS